MIAPGLLEADRARADASRRGWYEVYYVTASLGPGRALWLRWTLHAARKGPSSAAVWAVVFDREQPRRFAARRELPAASWRPRDGAGVVIDDAEVTPDSCRGRLADAQGRTMRWELRWSPLSAPFAFFPPPLERAAATATYPIVSIPLAVVDSGFVEVDGERIDCTGARLEQSHLFGGRHAHRWSWVHALGFADDPDGWLAMVWAVPARLGGRLPPVSSMGLRLHGRELQPRGLRGMRSVLWSDPGGESARFSAIIDDVTVEGQLSVPTDHAANVVYHDPDGSTVYCAHAGIADLVLRLRDRDGTTTAARCPAACAVERGTRRGPGAGWQALD